MAQALACGRRRLSPAVRVRGALAGADGALRFTFRWVWLPSGLSAPGAHGAAPCSLPVHALLLRTCGCLPGCVFPLLLARSWLALCDRLAVCNALPPKKGLRQHGYGPWELPTARSRPPWPMASMASGAPHNPRPPDLRSHLAEASCGPS